MVPSLSLLSCELSVSVKENPDRKKKNEIVDKITSLGKTKSNKKKKNKKSTYHQRKDSKLLTT